MPSPTLTNAAALSKRSDHSSDPNIQELGPSYQSPSMFNEAHNFVMQQPVFIDNSVISDNFMRELLQHTIIGAEFDSADRHPPHRCHPGTRVAIIERCLNFIIHCHDEGKLRWVFGAAGVGKSAIMQMIAEETPLDITLAASIFFSGDERNDGSKAIITIAYQLATRCEPYRHFIRDEISKDPSLLRKSLPVQFNKFIVEPFMHQNLFDRTHRFLLLIDGLDECSDPVIQQELLKLISDFCISYPSSPFAWIIASRPEPHIRTFFEKSEVQLIVTTEEIEVDSERAYRDVRLYLHDELNQVQLASTSLKHKQEWPTKSEFDKIATAAGGLFAYASALVQYFRSSRSGGPASRLCDVLVATDAGSIPGRSGKDHPLAQLDTLYAKILSRIPHDDMVNARNLLLLQHHHALVWQNQNFRLMCNLLGLTEDAAYGAICQMYSVMKIPPPDQVDKHPFTFYHKSFEDYFCDFERSGFARNVLAEAGKIAAQMSLRVVKEVPVDSGDTGNDESIEAGNVGYLKGGPDTCGGVSLSWPGDERFEMADNELKRQLYCCAIQTISRSFRTNHQAFINMTCFRVVTERFTKLGNDFPFYAVRRSIFDDLQSKVNNLDSLRQVPLRALDYAAVCGSTNFQFRSPTRMGIVDLPDPWNPSCQHRRRSVNPLPELHKWWTFFHRYQDSENRKDDFGDSDIPRLDVVAGENSHRQSIACQSIEGSSECEHCCRVFARYWMEHPDQLVTVFIDSTGLCYCQLVCINEGSFYQRYRFFHSGPPTL